jgi:Domain of unknown function (DUF4388)
MSFQGSIQELPVPDIIQLVSVSGKTGMFTLIRGVERGYIYLKNGQMIHAKLGELTGEEAIYALAIWSSGDFQFTPAEEPDTVSIEKSNTSLLMEAARRLDEWKVLSRKIPGVDHVPVLLPREVSEPVTLSPPEWNMASWHDRSVSPPSKRRRSCTDWSPVAWSTCARETRSGQPRRLPAPRPPPPYWAMRRKS